MATISTIQFKRGAKKALTDNLKSTKLGVLAQGEPAYETDTGGLKIGDGAKDYADLPYVSSSKESKFVIHDPVANQVLLYDADLGKWVNKDLSDDNSIIYLNSQGLTIKGYTNATQGQMPIKDSANGITWVTPVNATQLNQAVQNATNQAVAAGNSAISAANDAAAAEFSAGNAARINQQTMNWVNNKFWWGTLEEYNALTEINEGTFYFVKL